MRNYSVRFIATVWIFAVLSIASPGYAEQGLWTFASDPGFTERHDGADTNFLWSVSSGVLDITTTREAACQRISVPLVGTYDDGDYFRIRMRMKHISGSVAQMVGFFNLSNGQMDTNNKFCAEHWGNGSVYAIAHAGGSYNRGNGQLGSEWMIHELWYDGPGGRFGGSLYDSNNNLVASSTFSSSGSGIVAVNCFAFGNWDVNQDSATSNFQYDWITWSVNEPLLPDPGIVQVEINETEGTTEMSEEGATMDTYTVVLSETPTATVTIDIEDTGDPCKQVEINPDSLVFTTSNWNTERTVTVTAINDNALESNPHYTIISHSPDGAPEYAGLDIDAVNVTINENDCDIWPQHGAGLWLFDEGPDSINIWAVADQSYNRNHGTGEPVTGAHPLYVTDTPFSYTNDYALDFGTSTSARVEIPDSDSLDITGDLTVEAWVNMNSLSGSQHLVSKRNSSGPNSGYWLKWSDSSQAFKFYVATAAGVYNVQSQAFSPSTAQWYHIAGVHDVVAGKNRLYINGQLNNSAASDLTIVANDEMLVFGNRPNLAAPANAKLDQVRISNEVLPANRLGYWRSLGPGKGIWADNFETYSGDSDLFGRGGQTINHWNRLANGNNRGAYLTNLYSHSGNNSVLIYMNDATEYGNADIYLKLPLGIVENKVDTIGYEGWLAFDNVDDHRIILMNEVWTGNESHYGRGPDKLIAAVVEYNGQSKTWNKEVMAGHEPFEDGYREYEQGMNVWHYFKIVCSFQNNLCYSFQFDDDIWQWENLTLYTGNHPLDYTMIEVNIRMYYPYSTPPSGSVTAQIAVDDIAMINEDIEYVKPDFDGDCNVDMFDFSVFSSYWQQANPGIYDLSGDETIDTEDLSKFLIDWLYNPN